MHLPRISYTCAVFMNVCLQNANVCELQVMTIYNFICRLICILFHWLIQGAYITSAFRFQALDDLFANLLETNIKSASLHSKLNYGLNLVKIKC